MSHFSHFVQKPGRKTQACLFAALSIPLLGLAGCKHDSDGAQVAGWSLVEPRQKNPIIVSQQPERMNLSVARGSQGLSPSQRADVVAFASRYKASDSGNARIVISAPAGSSNETSALDAVDDVRSVLINAGFSEASIAIEAYHPQDRSNAPVRISYLQYVAEGPVCGHDWSNLAESRDNTPSKNFACAHQHNLAAMIANPADLLGPRTETARDGDRRSVAFSKWVKGESTGAQKGDEEKVQVQGGN